MTAVPPSTRRRGARSRLGGLPAELGPAGTTDAGSQQLALPLTGPSTGPALPPAGTRSEVLPAVVHLAGWLDPDQQRRLADDVRRWSQPPAGLRHPRVPTGHLMGVRSVCLGWHWYPYRYSRTADDTDGAPVKALPADLAALARRAVDDAYGVDSPDARTFEPDAAIVNHYPPGAHLGLHCDGEEPCDAPVVTLSLGDACTFRLAGVDRRTGPFTDVVLASGDLLVFGGPNRRIYHGVPKVLAGTAPADLGLPAGRVSITLRQTGLS